nr:sugar ABC transporter substrate-binding protein [Virgibacillus massiliensis]
MHVKIKWNVFILTLIILSFQAACEATESTTEVNIPRDPEQISGDITVWAWALEADFLESIVPQFQEKYPNVNVTINKQGPDQVYQRLITGLAANQGEQLPDLVQVEETQLLSYKENFPDRFTNLSELGYGKYEGQFAPAKEEAVKDENGDFLAMPRDLGPVGIFYRKDIFHQAGVEPASIETWEDYIDAGEVIQTKTGVNMLGLTLNETVPLYKYMLHQQGAFYFDSSGNIDVHSSESIRALETIQRMQDKKLITNVTNWDGRVSALKNGHVATLPGAIWWTGTMKDQMPELSGKWGAMPLPSFNEKQGQGANGGGSNLVIPKASTNKEAAYVFGEFATTEVNLLIGGLKNQGLFPSLLATYEEKEFQERQAYFDNEAVYNVFASIAKETPAVNYTSDYARANDIVNDEIVSMLLNGKPLDQVVGDIANTLGPSTGREVNKP